jgi:hypothetical protein
MPSTRVSESPSIFPTTNLGFAGWLKPILKLLPQALTELLSPRQGESLERLQLIKISIDRPLKPFDEMSLFSLHNVCIGRFTDGDNFLSLSFLVQKDGEEFSKVEIIYFVRGQKKYFLGKSDTLGVLTTVGEWLCGPEDIRGFFADIEQENTMLHEEKLASLARTSLTVPSVMVLATAVATLGDNLEVSERISVDFLAEVRLNEKVTLQKSLVDGVEHLYLLQDELMVARLSHIVSL